LVGLECLTEGRFEALMYQYDEPIYTHEKTKQESHAVTRKPRDAAAVLFGLKFADNIHYKLRKPCFRAPNIPAQNRI